MCACGSESEENECLITSIKEDINCYWFGNQKSVTIWTSSWARIIDIWRQNASVYVFTAPKKDIIVGVEGGGARLLSKWNFRLPESQRSTPSGPFVLPRHCAHFFEDKQALIFVTAQKMREKNIRERERSEISELAKVIGGWKISLCIVSPEAKNKPKNTTSTTNTNKSRSPLANLASSVTDEIVDEEKNEKSNTSYKTKTSVVTTQFDKMFIF
ncbi:hypothetical protein RFI_17607 [Reticulomyxa filosa]|uniref:Uncharacterized protein n=1 Tax=Reticulomyxa filosa TaxID=46433 RepID=X6N132_RETFI|nr:hypothetical protein RFI_17607 [Reticulomyxa filosa]|eukprot:ETO19623.1 hypothetical protein RFI_17607 [Reticulomyxa filosa]